MKCKSGILRILPRLAAIVMALALILSACRTDGAGKTVKLDPKNPITISVWHYYNGAIMKAFDTMIQTFNETVGEKEGIIVESYGHGSVSELEKAVISAANHEVGSMAIPDVFASYADTAYAAEEMDILANLDDYFSEKEQQEYISSYIEEGRIGKNGELKIFPIAKATEVFMINATDWRPFAKANGLADGEIQTMEDAARVAKLYYEWTDSLTPDISNDGKAFFGRDSMANLFIIASKEFGTELFHVNNRTVTLNVNEEVMRKIWDTYYVPYISGYFSAYGRFRSDDAKVGDIIAYVGSTSSASFFPTEVTVDGKAYPVEADIYPVLHFEGAKKTMIQQGAGMVVTKGTPQEEYASVVFLKWFTQTQENTEFAALSGYMPVRKDAVDYDTFIANADKFGMATDDITMRTLKVALEETRNSELYTNKAFSGGSAARSVLEATLRDKAHADRESVVGLIEGGSAHQEAVAQFNTDSNFKSWLAEMTAALNESIAPQNNAG